MEVGADQVPTTCERREIDSKSETAVPSTQLPFPLRNEDLIDGTCYAAKYIGHEQKKVTFLLDSRYEEKYCGLVLKVVCPAQEDMKCEVMCLLNNVRCEASVEISRKGQVSFQALPEMPAWLCKYAMPLDQFLQQPVALPEICVLSALLAILRAAKGQVIVSDLGFYNFGVIRDQVCIIDAGSRSL